MNDDKLFALYLKFCDASRAARDARPLLDELAAWARTRRRDSKDTWQAEAHDCLYAIAASPDLFAIASAQWLTREEDVPLGQALLHEVSVRYLK